jgi:hypothetical protein
MGEATMEQTTIRLTGPQSKALMWLPANGAWSGKLTRDIASAVDSLRLYHQELVETQAGSFGPRGGWIRRARLTDAGIRERQRRTEGVSQNG